MPIMSQGMVEENFDQLYTLGLPCLILAAVVSLSRTLAHIFLNHSVRLSLSKEKHTDQ